MPRALTSRAYPNTVIFQPRSTTVDDEGVVEADWPSAGGIEMPASVQGETVNRVEGDGTVVTDTTYSVLTQVDPGASEGDRFVWTEPGRADRVLVAQGPSIDEGGRGVSWTTTCREVVE